MEIKTAELICKYLTGEISDSENTQLDQWLAADERHARLLEDLRDGRKWRDREEALSGIDLARAMCRFETRMGRSHRKRISRFLRYAAVVIPAMAVAGFILWRMDFTGSRIPADIMPGSPKASLYTDGGEPITITGGEERFIAVSTSQNVYYDGRGIIYDAPAGDDEAVQRNKLMTPRGGEFVVDLSDGTRVWLNAETTLEYPSSFAGGDREVRLAGEAFFEVEHDGRPFRVLTGDAMIEVLGTSFGVSCYPEQPGTSAVLETGSIVFSAGNREVELTHGERVVFDNGRIDLQQVDVRYHTAWRHGNFYFDDQPLSEIMTILSRWYNVDFVFADPSLKAICFSGVALRTKPCDYVLKMLEQTHTVRFTKRDGNTIAVEKV